MKKFLALLLALVMVMGLATTAFAAEETVGTIINTTNRDYDAYQIFSGTQGKDAVLGDVEWGEGINATFFLAALKTNLDDFDDCTTAADVAAVLAGNSNLAKTFANLAVNYLTTLTAQVDANEEAELPSGYYLLVDASSNNPTQNPALLQVTNGTLKITEKVPGVPAPDKNILEGGQKVKDTDANIGDTVTFELSVTLPSSFENYEAYMLTFIDTLSKGLTYNNDAVVKVNGNVVTCYNTTTAPGEDGSTVITVKNNDDNIMNDGIVAGDTVTVTYSATLNENAVVGAEGNPNSFVLRYSNNPDDPQDYKETEPKKVKVYTWEVNVFKYTGTEKTPLAGAGFTLYTNEACTNAVNVVATETANVYKVCTKTGCTHTHVTEIVTDTTGKFVIKGLAEGTYYLKETTTPAGYNTCANVTVTIGANGALTQDGTATAVIGVLNNAGSTLPETGGMGTTMFYIFGFTMMMAAVVLLVTKKRMADAV